MDDYSAAAAYQLSSARGASPVGLVVALYDTILRDFRRAVIALDSGNVESRVFELNHALTVIAHLHDVLDHERGGQAAAQLSRYYEVTRAMILAANASGSRTAILKLMDLYGGMRNAWEQAERQLGSSDQAAKPSPLPPLRALNEPHVLASQKASGARSSTAEPVPAGSSGRWSA